MKPTEKLDKQWLEFWTWEERLKEITLPYYENPKTDNDRLINAQYRFIKSGMKDQSAEAELWLGAYNMAMNLIKKEMKAKRLHYDQDEREIKAGIATDYVLRRYKTLLNDKNEIYVIKNFVVQMRMGVIHALYHEEENDFILDSAIDLESADRMICKGGTNEEEKSAD